MCVSSQIETTTLKYVFCPLCPLFNTRFKFLLNYFLCYSGAAIKAHGSLAAELKQYCVLVVRCGHLKPPVLVVRVSVQWFH